MVSNRVLPQKKKVTHDTAADDEPSSTDHHHYNPHSVEHQMTPARVRDDSRVSS